MLAFCRFTLPSLVQVYSFLPGVLQCLLESDFVLSQPVTEHVISTTRENTASSFSTSFLLPSPPKVDGAILAGFSFSAFLTVYANEPLKSDLAIIRDIFSGHLDCLILPFWDSRFCSADSKQNTSATASVTDVFFFSINYCTWHAKLWPFFNCFLHIHIF